MDDLTINSEVTLSGENATVLAGRYRIVRQLGQGGMGSVWLAEDTKLDGFKVAVKMLPSVLVNNKRAYAQVKAEALVSLKLSHSNIATVRAFEEEGGSPFLVMDYIDGQTLDDYLAEKGKLSEDETIRLLKPVAAALDYAHAQGVVHRDVKPGNVMIRRDGTPFVLDFGIAREIQETMTRVTGKLSSGTLLYMSPEQLNGDAPKPAQDIYSFAAMAYECLKGEPPFSRGGVEDQIKHKLPEPLGPQFANCGQGVMAGLAKSPEARPMTCAAALEKGGKKVAKTSTGASASKTRIAVVGALLVLAALAGIGGWFGWSAYCRAEEHRLATIKAEMERKSAWHRLELETDRLASQVDEAQRVSVREQFAKREGLAAKVKELEDAAKSGQLALSATNLVAATNWFHVALSCYNWLSSNAVLHAQCMQAAQAALNARKAADEADAKNLASNEYDRAVIAFGQADEGLKAARFEEARSRWMKSAGLFEDAERNAAVRRKAEADRVAAKVVDLKRAFDEMRFKEIVNDPDAEKIPELRFLSGLVYENGLGDVPPDLKRAVALYGGTTGVCVLAEAHLAQMLLSGDYLDKDASEITTNRIVACLPEIQSRADKGETLAAYALYNVYDDGIGVKKDRQLGKKWLERAASGGNVFAKCELAVFAYRGNDVYPMERNRYASLMRELESAQWYASFYLRGMLRMQEKQRDLAEQDILRSLSAIRSLALQGSAMAQVLLGDMYDDGCGVPKDPKEAVRWHRLAADKGNASAQAKLAWSYWCGAGVDKDENEAMRWAKNAAEQENSLGQELLGVFYRKGMGVKKNPEVGFQWIKKSAENGPLEAMEILGDCYRNGEGVAVDKREAVRWYRKAADCGWAGAQNMLGLMYDNGEGCEKDVAEANKWYEMAVKKGHAAAMFNLGINCCSGDGCRKDLDKAFSLLRQSAQNGFASAQYHLGEAYRTGQFCPVDEHKAFSWINKAAGQGYVEAQNALGVMYEKGEGCEKNIEKAVEWYRKAAEQGHVCAMYNIGITYYNGSGVAIDKREAFRWISMAAEKGDVDAQNQLGYMYQHGEGCIKDAKKAFFWYKKAAEKGQIYAMYNLSLSYRAGDGIAVDKREAFRWMMMAAEKGNIDAQEEIGRMYEEGFGVARNYAKAREWYMKAADKGNAIAENNLGVLYMDGKGVEENAYTAKYWLERSMRHGDSMAPCNLGTLYQNGRLGARDIVEARRLYKISEQRGESRATKRLSEIGR